MKEVVSAFVPSASAGSLDPLATGRPSTPGQPRRATVTNERSPERPTGTIQQVFVEGPPKSAAGPDVAIPSIIVPELRAHLGTWSEDGPDGRVFVGPKAPRPGGRSSSGRGTGPSRRRGTEGARAPGRLPRPARRQERKSAPDLRPGRLERVTRIELAFSAWEADVLPLNYTRMVDSRD